MTGLELCQARKRLNLSAWELGLALGMEGGRVQIKNRIHKFEAGQKAVPEWVAVRVSAMALQNSTDGRS